MRYGVFMGYSRGIHGVFICIGYVSVMCRLCVGNVTEKKSSEGGIKKTMRAINILALARRNSRSTEGR